MAASLPLKANAGISCPGLKLHGAGFIVTPEEAVKLGLGVDPEVGQYIRPYRNGRDLTDHPRDVLVIDLFGLDADTVILLQSNSAQPHATSNRRYHQRSRPRPRGC